MVHKLVLLRHGESTWNQQNLFAGWTDVPLSATGEEEAKFAGVLMKEKEFEFDKVYTSYLRRAVTTTWIVLTQLEQFHIPILNSWRLNERHYGTLQGLDKRETARLHGEEQVKIWRRSYDVPPPSLDVSDERWGGHSKLYTNVPKGCLPFAECLKDTYNRVLPFWFDQIAPAISRGERILVSAHGNSIRALVKYLDNISDEDIIELNIPTGVPLVYELDNELRPIKHYYLMDEEEVKRRIDAVANQASLKKPTA